MEPPLIDPSLYAAFVLAVAILILIPGPNVALIVANSVAYGTRFGLLTVAGTGSGMVLALGLTGLGMTAVLGTVAVWFGWIRWIGVAYLIYLGLKQWRAPTTDLTKVKPQPKSPREIFWRGFLVSLANPKTLLFYGAFFPQFIRVDRNLTTQIVILSVTFVVVAVVLDGAWAVVAGRARGVLAARARLRNRLSGSLLIGAGLGLALVRQR